MQVVYCIDDNEMIVKMLSYQLEKFFDPKCFVVEGHSCPLKAIEAIRNNYSNGFPPIVCIVDFQMPQMNGDEFIKIIRSEFPMSKALMLSGNSNAFAVSDLVEENLLDFYLSKPWDEKDLFTKVKSCLPLNLQMKTNDPS